jgi:hypothetical protein
LKRNLGAAPAQSDEAPVIDSVALMGRHPRIGYEVPGGRDALWPRLILSIDEKGDGGIPPLTKVIRRVDAEGEVVLPFKVDPSSKAVVLASVIYRNGHRSPIVRRQLGP